jgi:signal transduction histidine kinase
VNDCDPADLQRRLERLQQQLVQHHVDDPVLRATQAELTAIVDRLSDEAAEQRHAQAALDAERQRLAEQIMGSWETFHMAPEACILTDSEGIIRQANAAAVELFAGTRPVERGALVLLFAPDDRARVHVVVTACGRNKATESTIATIARRDQSPLRAEVRCAPVAGDQLLWHIRDVTEEEAARARLEDVLQRERDVSDKLRKFDEARTAFLLAVSHDLQAPLAAIAGLAGLLLEQRRMAARDRRRMLEQIHSSSERLLADLRDLLVLERLHRGDIGLERERIDIASLVRSVAESVDFGDRRLVIDAEPTTANVDPVIVRRILQNLLANSVRHTPPGTTVWARVRTEPDGVLLVVEDDGPGVPENLRDRLFDLFSRDPRSDGGLGVGLALVRQFTELHGGTVRVEARRGGGASFHVLLPSAFAGSDAGMTSPAAS